jgi:F420-0:gamma-glutamyl ligase
MKNRIPVKTHILGPEDDIVEVIKKYAGNKIDKNTIVVIAESPLAITQGRFFYPDYINIGYFAKRLCLFFPQIGSLASPFAMQLLINEVGLFRVLTSFVIGSVLKVFGQKGVFYKLCGKQSALIDDTAGTIQPYDKVIVMGPKDPDNTAEEISQSLGGVGVAIVDANDLGVAWAVGCSKGLDSKEIENIMKDNPAGNADEQTPIVLIK